MSRIIFRESYIIVLPTFSSTAAHRHPFLHLFCGAEGCHITLERQQLQGHCLLTGANVPHAVPPGSGVAFFLLIDPTSQLAQSLCSRHLTEQRACSIPQAGNLPADLVGSLSDGEIIRLVEDMLGRLSLCAEPGPAMDERVRQVIGQIASGQWLDLSVGEIAARVYLSESRLTHLFRDSAGIALKSYLIIRRLERAYRFIAGGGKATRAAHESGFASSAHLAYTCRKLTGVSITDVMKSAKTADF